MADNKSQEQLVKLFNAILTDVSKTSHGETFTQRAIRLTTCKVAKRVAREGMGFLTKTMPRLCKAFDKALLGAHPLNAAQVGFDSYPGCEFPRFLGELFSKVLSSDGSVLSEPCVTSIRHIRCLLLIFYKLDLPYSPDQEQKVITQFKETEQDLNEHDRLFNAACSLRHDIVAVGYGFASNNATSSASYQTAPSHSLGEIPSGLMKLPESLRTQVRRARRVLNKLFSTFDPTDIVPRHGPGSVSTKEKLWGKFHFSSVSPRTIACYPLDAYFYASLGHVVDRMDSFQAVSFQEDSAQVILVPKDSRGPRLISCEPLAFQWVQQGLGRAIVHHVERHPLTRYNVHFTDQGPNQCGALLGSSTGRYATLDLKEASDRVSLGLVRLIFPSKILTYLEGCRSLTTELPSGEVLTLKKFAPMGSALCFPVLALTIWALLYSRAQDADTRDGILVYGDDVIVPTHMVGDAIEQLESFGLLVNREKSCATGFFRESCGTDAYKGTCVTPIRLRKGLPSTSRPGLYPSSIAFCNALYDRGYFCAYELYRDWIHIQYGQVPDDDMGLTVPSLREVESKNRPTKWRINPFLQKKEWFVKCVEPRSIVHSIDGWSMLLRSFTEGGVAQPSYMSDCGSELICRHVTDARGDCPSERSFASDEYTPRDSIKITRRWR